MFCTFQLPTKFFPPLYGRLIMFYCFTPKKNDFNLPTKFSTYAITKFNFFSPLSTNCKLNSNFLRDKLMQLFFLLAENLYNYHNNC